MWNLACQRVNTRRERIDCGIAIERADLDVVRPRFAWRQVRQLASLAGIEAPSVAVGGRLHRDPVYPLSEHPPHGVERELVLPVDLVGTQADAAVDNCDGHGAARLRDR